MKIALVLTGHQRKYTACYPSVKKFILDRHGVDVYLSTWNSNYYSRGQSIDPATGSTMVSIPADIQPLLDLYNPVKVHVEKQEEYYATKTITPYFNQMIPWSFNGQTGEQPGCECNWNRFNLGPKRECTSPEVGCDALEMMKDQWYMVKKGFELIDNPSQYDLVMKLRLDILFHHFEFEENLPKGTIVVPREFTDQIPGWPEYMTNDHLAYGDPDSMDKYCHWHDYYVDDCVNKVVPVKCEMAIGYHIRVRNGINVIRDAVNLHYEIAPKV
jgi:hypothetical protein